MSGGRFGLRVGRYYFLNSRSLCKTAEFRLPAATEHVPVSRSLTLAITNRLVKQSSMAVAPTPAPARNQWMLALPSLVQGAFALMGVRRSRMN